MDELAAVTTALYNELVNNTALQAIFAGQVNVHYVFPDEEAPPLPYFVHRLDLEQPPAGVAISVGTWYLDIWDYSDTAQRATLLRKAVVEAFDQRILSIPESKHISIQLSRPNGFVPDTELGIWHYALGFRVRYTRHQEASAIATRA
jgi:hypothetical protein